MSRTTASIGRARRNPLFARCTNDELTFISSKTTAIVVGVGTVLAREGRRSQQFCVITEGTAGMLVGECRVATLRPGDFFGETVLTDDVASPMTVIADSELALEVADPREFMELIFGAPSAALAIVRILARRRPQQDGVKPLPQEPLRLEDPIRR
jgi:CRP-like cAMP-binding protein